MRITVDPKAEAGGFGYAEPGRYTLRVKGSEVKQKPGGEFPYLKVELEFADPNVQSVPVDGKVMKVGGIFENLTLSTKNNGQFRLRQFCDSLGLVWGDFDTEDLIGHELEAQIKVKEYEGNFSNEIAKYIPKG